MEDKTSQEDDATNPPRLPDVMVSTINPSFMPSPVLSRLSELAGRHSALAVSAAPQQVAEWPGPSTTSEPSAEVPAMHVPNQPSHRTAAGLRHCRSYGHSPFGTRRGHHRVVTWDVRHRSCQVLPGTVLPTAGGLLKLLQRYGSQLASWRLVRSALATWTWTCHQPNWLAWCNLGGFCLLLVLSCLVLCSLKSQTFPTAEVLARCSRPAQSFGNHQSCSLS